MALGRVEPPKSESTSLQTDFDRGRTKEKTSKKLSENVYAALSKQVSCIHSWALE